MDLYETFPRPPGPYTRLETFRIWLASKIMGHTTWSKVIHDLAPIIPQAWRDTVTPEEWLR